MISESQRAAWSAEEREQDEAVPLAREEVVEYPAPEAAARCGDLGPGDESLALAHGWPDVPSETSAGDFIFHRFGPRPQDVLFAYGLDRDRHRPPTRK